MNLPGKAPPPMTLMRFLFAQALVVGLTIVFVQFVPAFGEQALGSSFADRYVGPVVRLVLLFNSVGLAMYLLTRLAWPWWMRHVLLGIAFGILSALASPVAFGFTGRSPISKIAFLFFWNATFYTLLTMWLNRRNARDDEMERELGRRQFTAPSAPS